METQRQPDYDSATGTTKPIEINFTGPKSLKPAPDTKLEIRDPSGAPLDDAVVALEVVNAHTDPAEYRFTWSGLKRPAGTPTWYQPDGKPLPAGDYKVRVIATTSEDAVLESALYEKISLVEVRSIGLSHASGLDLSANPGRGGGKRIFAEARERGDAVTDRVRVTAAIFPPITDALPGQGVTVLFRSLDVDDPSASEPPVDNEFTGDDNCLPATPPQPIVDCQIPDAGLLNGKDGDAIVAIPVPVGSSTVTVEMQVSTRPGDNYRVAASTSPIWLGGLLARHFCPVNETCIPAEVRDAGTDRPVENVSITEMLTVWRTLHLEVDVMEDAVEQVPSSDSSGVEYLDVLGTVTAVTPNTLTAQGLPMVTDDHDDDADQWNFADLWPRWPDGTGTGPLRVVGSTASTLTVSNPQVGAPPLNLTTLTEPGAVFRLSDDRKAALASVPVRLERTRDLLASAYIALDDNPPGNATTMIAFDRHFEDEDVRRLPRNIDSSPDYWTVLLVKGYDGPMLQDHDPNDPQHPLDLTATNELARCGTTTDALRKMNGKLTSQPRQPTAIFFTETLRDRAAAVGSTGDGAANIIAHEILCHALGNHGGHLEGSTICTSPSVESAKDISDSLRAVLRALPYPTVRD